VDCSRQAAAAAQMAAAERNGMIKGMVPRLAQRLSENGSDVDGWLSLIRAYSIVGERDKALAAAANARSALAGNDGNLRRFGELAKELRATTSLMRHKQTYYHSTPAR
jgi:cytochrome c-type biogenesis protein CcmH